MNLKHRVDELERRNRPPGQTRVVFLEDLTPDQVDAKRAAARAEAGPDDVVIFVEYGAVPGGG